MLCKLLVEHTSLTEQSQFIALTSFHDYDLEHVSDDAVSYLKFTDGECQGDDLRVQRMAAACEELQLENKALRERLTRVDRLGLPSHSHDTQASLSTKGHHEQIQKASVQFPVLSFSLESNLSYSADICTEHLLQ